MYGERSACGGGCVAKERGMDAEVKGATRSVVSTVCRSIGEEDHLCGKCSFAHQAHTVFVDKQSRCAQFGIVIRKERKISLVLKGALKGLSDFFSPVGCFGNKGGRDLHVTLVF